MQGFSFKLSMLFRWSMCLFLYQHHAVLITTALFLLFIVCLLNHTQTPSPLHPITLSASSGQSSVPRPDVGNRATVAAPVEFPRTRPGTRPARQLLSSRLQRRVSHRGVGQRPAQSRSFPDGSRGFVRSGPPSVSTAGTSLPSKCPHAKRVK